jgi:hypothetical protein
VSGASGGRFMGACVRMMPGDSTNLLFSCSWLVSLLLTLPPKLLLLLLRAACCCVLLLLLLRAAAAFDAFAYEASLTQYSFSSNQYHPPLLGGYGPFSAPLQHIPFPPYAATASSQHAYHLQHASASGLGDDVPPDSVGDEIDYHGEAADTKREGCGLPLTAAMRDKWMR